MVLINMSGHPVPRGAEGFDVVDVAVPNVIPTPEAIQAAAEALVAEAEGKAGEAIARGEFEVMLPGMTPLAATVLAVFHGRAGHFPVMRFAVRRDGVFELSGSLDLQAVRLRARGGRR